MKIFKIVFIVGVLCVLCNESFASGYRVMGDFTVKDKAESDTLKVDLAALSKITEAEKLDVIQSTKTEDAKTTESLSLDIVFKDDTEARDYFEQLKKQGVDAHVRIHKCTNSEYSGMPNVSCVIEEEATLTKP